MPLTRAQKEDQLAVIEEQLDQANTLYLTDPVGLTVDEVTRLRRAFREADIQFKVLKNTLLRRVLEQRGGYGELADQLHGPTAVAFSTDPSAPAKVLKKYLSTIGEKQLPRFKGAFIDGAVFGEGQLDALATLKSKDELIGDVIGLLLSPMQNVIGALNAPGATLAGALKELAEREEA
ncbi:MAG TPA: 50S ribosomal protein L10 [Rhodothermales bacterium]|nr:50S ribosomal protein L10 [Rhodothermales bacterium]